MRKLFSLFVVVVLCFSVVSGCSKGKTVENAKLTKLKEQVVKNADEAIKTADTLKALEDKKDYLISQAQSLYSSEQFQEAIKVAEHVLANIDAQSLDAKKIVEDATEQTRQFLMEKGRSLKDKI